MIETRSIDFHLDFHPEKKLPIILKLNFPSKPRESKSVLFVSLAALPFALRIFTPFHPDKLGTARKARRNSETCNQRALQSRSFEERERESPPPPLLCNRESRFNPLHRLYTLRRLNALEREFRLVCFTLSRDDEETFSARCRSLLFEQKNV